MTTIAFLLLLLLNSGIVFVYWVTVHRKEGPASPLGIVLLFYLFNYPLRAIMLFVAAGTDLEWAFNSRVWLFSQDEICAALFYATLFVGCLVMVYSMRSGKRQAVPHYYKRKSQQSGLNTNRQRMVFFSLFLAYIVFFAHQLVSGELFGLYESIEDLKRPFLVNLIGIISHLKWFLVAYAFLRVQRTKSTRVIILAISVSATIIISALVSTGKGDLVALALLWAICVWLVRGKIPKFTFALATIAVIMFAFYSYTARRLDYAGIRSMQGSSIVESISRTADIVLSAHNDDAGLWKEQAGAVFSRFQGMDGLIMCQRRNSVFGDGLYVAGSLVEFGNAVPRLVWPTRPHLSLNHHVTHAVWGWPDYYLVELPIGRIGESFYVLNWGGLLYAILYAYLWRWFYKTFMLRSRNDLDTAFYLSVLFLMVLPDAYLTYNWQRLVVMVAAYFFLRSNGGIRVGNGKWSLGYKSKKEKVNVI